MCERRSHYHYQSEYDYGRRKHHHPRHSDEQFLNEAERTMTGERHHHERPQPFNEFEKRNHHHHHHHHPLFGHSEQFEGHHNHCNQHFSPFQQFVKPEKCKFCHQQFQFPFKFESICNQQFWPFARSEKFEKRHKHHCHQQFSPYGRFGQCPQFSRPETCERRHPPFGQFWSFNGPCQFERYHNFYSQWQQFLPFQPFEKPCQFEKCHKHHCHQQFSPFRQFVQCPQFSLPKTGERHHPPFGQFWSFNGPCKFERRHKHHCHQQFYPCGSFTQKFSRPETCERRIHHQCGRFRSLSTFGSFAKFKKHHHRAQSCGRLKTYPLFGLFKYQKYYKHCSQCRRTCSPFYFRKKFCRPKFDEDSSSSSRIQHRMFKKQLRRCPIKHHFHHHKAHRFHHHMPHW